MRPKLTYEMIDEAVKLKKLGLYEKDIAAAIGVAPQTFSTWQHDPKTPEQRELAEAMKRAEADGKKALLAIIQRDARERDWKAAAWMLERRYPEEFARPEVYFARQAAREAAEATAQRMEDIFVQVRRAADEG